MKARRNKQNVVKFTATTASRLFVTLVLATGAALVWEGFNTLHPPQTGSLREWAFGLWKIATGRN